MLSAASTNHGSVKPRRRVARVLLADARLASRLTLKLILSTAGYAVNGVATAAEALLELDAHEYQLVLADLRAESEEAGPQVLAYARQKAFRPATALLSSDMLRTDGEPSTGASCRAVHISDENVSDLLCRVAELINRRADRRIRMSLLEAGCRS